MPEIKTIYDSWQDGTIQTEEALNQLCQSLASLQDRLEPLKEQEQILRAQISEVVESMGGRAELKGFGTMQITGASISASYDRKKLDTLVTKLVQQYPEIAQAISACRSESMRAGGLVIRKERGSK